MDTRMMRFVLFVIVVMLLAAGCTKVNKVTPLAEVEKGKTGVLYILPKTQLVVEVPIVIKYKNGALRFAEQPETSTKKGDPIDCTPHLSGRYKIETDISIGDVKITPESVADVNQIYNIDIDSSFLKDSKKDLKFNESMMLLSGSFSSKDKTLEFVVKTVETAAKLIPAIAGVPLNANMNVLNGEEGERILEVKGNSDADICKGNLDNVLSNIKQLKVNYALVLSKKERLLFGENSGGMDRNLDVYKARMADISAFMASLEKSMSLDEVVTVTYKKRVDVDKFGDIPVVTITNGTIKDAVAADFLEGEAALKYVKGEKLVNIKKNGNTVVSLRIEEAKNNPASTIANKGEVPKDTKGLYYRVPAQANVSYIKNSNVIQTKTMSIAQLGPVMSLPTTMHSTDSAITFEFFADTGALKSIGTENKAIDMEQVGKLGDAGVSLVQAIYASNDEITKLKQEKEKLTLQKDIRDLKTSLQTGQ